MDVFEWSVLAADAFNGRLPEDFDQWDLRDPIGQQETLAQIAERGKILLSPKESHNE